MSDSRAKDLSYSFLSLKSLGQCSKALWDKATPVPGALPTLWDEAPPEGHLIQHSEGGCQEVAHLYLKDQCV